MSNEDIIKYMYENQDKESKRLNLNFKRYVSTKMEGGIVLKNYLQLKIYYDRIHLSNVVSINTIICYEVRQ